MFHNVDEVKENPRTTHHRSSPSTLKPTPALELSSSLEAAASPLQCSQKLSLEVGGTRWSVCPEGRATFWSKATSALTTVTMACQLAAMVASDGVPLFVRSTANEKITFPQLGSLNGVWMFCKSSGAQIESVTLEDGGVMVWKAFGNVLFIFLAYSTGGPRGPRLGPIPVGLVHQLLEAAWYCCLFVCGREGLSFTSASADHASASSSSEAGPHPAPNSATLERVKRELKATFRLIDPLLMSLVNSPPVDMTSVVLRPDWKPCPEQGNLKNVLLSFCTLNDTPYGCFVSGSRLLVATEAWMSLCRWERLTLSLAIAAGPDAAALDLPIYLPDKSPNICYRLIVVPLMPSFSICLLCGSEPPLALILQRVLTAGFPIPLLRAVSAGPSPESPLPKRVPLDPSIRGFLLVSVHDSGDTLSWFAPSMSSAHPQRMRAGDAFAKSNRSLLASFYRESCFKDDNVSECHTCVDSYRISSDHSLFFLGSGDTDYQLLTLFGKPLPRQSLQKLSESLLDLLMNELKL
ncbi:unnamed protein product [Cyprideis torosa]|uniref:Uncharacterized protein n=1 Tax=Cyprideis torosa TaxID=163714 RepID=A0A7R8WE02_9CRUS|nr:unnamed protein product [Cyprideis torosa]CAG0892357.1 unnamed protein product [Cyprideis torosa]